MTTKLFDIIKSDLDELETALYESVVSPVDTITEIGNHLIKSGGKRLRPAMFFLAARCSKDFDLKRVMPLAVALELIHMASLVHDDVLDSASTRRGEATANAKWGNQLAILAGDYLFAKAFMLVTDNGYGDYVNNQLSRLLADLSAGELIQNKEIYKASCDTEEYYERIAMKTANFLAISCQLGGHVMGLPEAEVKALYDYGYSVGMAFQLTDDLLDLTGDSKTIGKPAGNDILQGIITLPAIRALETSSDRDELLNIVTDRNMNTENLERAIEIVRASGGIDFTKKKVEEYLDRARNVLPDSIPVDVREAYYFAADFIAGRKF
ncbi:Heptaprenyl diphosphate synthase component II [Anaerovibrio sp. JC8]|uniref:polyprenyl synthetase family protein n=1 Tax=Anaerovibrio sp. JC8 TaxID=1240085 RepID=UPI000A0D09EC|nr:polyprenyl synthetase family protein [Anaerovibrio sp. JC8]ORU01454.1 Heptaprenyl diphosphate synthase component II [Anaerovibrio sp. JC8]